eukprot:2543776-Heterocapsa_arctica.AAC.1
MAGRPFAIAAASIVVFAARSEEVCACASGSSCTAGSRRRRCRPATARRRTRPQAHECPVALRLPGCYVNHPGA